ncbi:MAG: hypothetical protein JO304_15425 [Solirubrobacterales bacterium]|nr:hypothetical protein [Solirubrobacterales bacterium]
METTAHHCLITPCPVCAIESRLDVGTDSRWRGDAQELRKTVEQLGLLRRQWGLEVAEVPSASPARDRERPTMWEALNAVRRSRPYTAPVVSDYLCY